MPSVDTLLEIAPWFPINASPPPDYTTEEIIQQISHTAARMELLAESPQMLELYCAMAHKLLPKGESVDSINSLIQTLNLKEYLRLINQAKVHAVCGSAARFGNLLLRHQYPDIECNELHFGEGTHSHTVSLWKLENTYLYFDVYNNVTLRKANGDTIDFRNAFILITEGKYDSVSWKIIPEYFGPDFELLNPREIAALATDYQTALELWPAYFSLPFDSAWFCSHDSVRSLGYYRGNHFKSWSERVQNLSDKHHILEYIQQSGYAKELMNWWRIFPKTNNTQVQEFLDEGTLSHR